VSAVSGLRHSELNNFDKQSSARRIAVEP